MEIICPHCKKTFVAEIEIPVGGLIVNGYLFVPDVEPSEK